MVPNEGYTMRDIPDSDISMADQSDIDAKNDLIDLTQSNDVFESNEEGDGDPSNLTTSIDLIQGPPSNLQVLKTTDRLISDIVNDLSMFELGFETGILKLSPISYATVLSSFLQSHKNDPVYKLAFINNYFEYAPSQQVLPDGLIILRGFIYKKKNTSNPFNTPTSPLFNVKLIIKHDINKEKLHFPHKHTFYHIPDDELTPENRKSLVTDYSQIYENAKTFYNKEEVQAIEKAIPNVIDYANFISSATRTLMRIEISQGIFTKDALKNFEEEEIALRVVQYNSALSSGVTATPSTTQCFESITRVLKGPLTQVPNTAIKTIRSDHAILNVHVGVNFMEKYFSFKHNSEIGELFPPNLNLPLLRESFVTLYLEALYFSRSTLVTYGDEKIVSRMLNETVEFGSSILNLEEMRLNSLSSFIALSCTCKYTDDDIRELYTKFNEVDLDNSLRYFDYLEDISNQKNSFNLRGLVIRLKNEGKMGFRDLCECYRILEIPPEEYNIVDDHQLLQQYSGLSVCCSTSMEKERLRDSLMRIGKLRRSLLIVHCLNSEPVSGIERAYDILEVNENVDNDLIITALEVKKSDIPSEANLYDRAFLTVALYRKSFSLLSYIEKKLPYLNKGLDLDFSRAWDYLGVDIFANDFQIITIFQERLAKDVSIDIRLLRFYLRHIGIQKKSKLITEFLKKGIIEPLFLPVDNTPVGLNNIGNTCYLNSLLQYYFVIEPLRSLILNFNELIDEENFNSNPIFSKRRIGSRTVGFKETERSYQFVYQLRDLFEELIKSKSRCISPKKELAYLSFSPSTDEVEFRTESEESDTSNMLLIPLGQLNGESPIVIDSSASLGSSPHSVFTINSNNYDQAQESLEKEDETALEEFDLLTQSPVKRRLSTESCEKISSNKSANKGRSDSREETDMEILIDDQGSNQKAEQGQGGEKKRNEYDNQGEEIIDGVELQSQDLSTSKPKKNTSATCHISSSQMENALEMGRQQDVTECIQNVLFQLESAFTPDHLEEDDEQYDLIKRLFYGKTKQILQPIDTDPSSSESVGSVRSKIERFLSLLVNIGDHPKDIYDALDTYFTEDVIKMDDGDVKRTLTITEIPSVLQIQIQRVQFDRERLMPVKSIEPIPFEEKLYMDRYMETDDEEIIKRRKDVVDWKQKISMLNLRKKELNKTIDDSVYNLKDGLTVFRNYLETNVLDQFLDLGLKPETVDCLNTVLKDINTREETITNDLKVLQDNIANQFKDFTKVGYSLFAIFIHRGEASYGHYWIYIKDPKRDIYRKYNDEMVTEVSREEVFNFEEGNTATPYFLVYVKEDLERSFVDPLRREVIIKEEQNEEE